MVIWMAVMVGVMGTWEAAMVVATDIWEVGNLTATEATVPITWVGAGKLASLPSQPLQTINRSLNLIWAKASQRSTKPQR